MIRHRRTAAVVIVAASLIASQANALSPSYASPPVQRPTFAASVVGLAVPQTGVMDAVCISGSATRIVRIKRITVSGIDATAQAVGVSLVKRTTANTGGTSTSPTPGALDSTSAAPTASLKAYTVAPTPGTLAATLRSQVIALNTANVAAVSPVSWDYSMSPESLSQEIVLRSASESACINFPAAFTTAGPTLNVDVTWTE